MKKGARYFYYLFAILLSKIIFVMPYRLSVKIGGLAGLLAYYLIGDSRRIVVENISMALPELSAVKVRDIAKKTFVNQGKNAFELFSFPKLNKNNIFKIVRFTGRDNMQEAVGQNKGVLMTSAHCGNWEMIGPTLSYSGFSLNVIARKIYIEGLNRLLVNFRLSKGYRVILRSGQESAKQILRSLRQKEILALLIDQDTDVPGVFVKFFGKDAWTPSGLAALARRTGAAVTLALDVRKPDDTHEVLMSGPYKMQLSDDESADILANTQLLTLKIEEHIRKYPDQWVWMHKRWKTKIDNIS